VVVTEDRVELARLLGAEIRCRRLLAGLTQEQLAEKSGVSRTYLARLETGRQDPTLSTLEKLAKALGVKASRLLE
jgi:transcriptional regulator with XRE-family HTH domain